MTTELPYEAELQRLYNNIQKSFSIKIGTLSALNTNYYLGKLIKLNNKTKNENIEEIFNLIGKINTDYKYYCYKNNFYTDPFVNKKIKDSYIKLSTKLMKIKTTRKEVLNTPTKMKIVYDSNKGYYKVSYYKNGEKISSKNYKVNNLKNLSLKREHALKTLKRKNYNINVFDELNIDETKAYKLNPYILNILIKENKIDYAKMYMKEVIDGNTIYKPFEINYILNKDLSKGIFSSQENKNMKKMAKQDSISSKLIIFNDTVKNTNNINSHILDDIKNSLNSKKSKLQNLTNVYLNNKNMNINKNAKPIVATKNIMNNDNER